ncbi:hypothetical protein ACHAXS_002406 [Conticribra weissflogii]
MIVDMRDISRGFICGLIFISVLTYLDHHGILRVGLKRPTYESAVKSIAYDLKRLSAIEASTGLKFITFEQYNKLKMQLNKTLSRIEVSNEDLKERIRELAEIEVQLQPYRREYEELIKHSALELDKYCGSCFWMNRYTCDKRVKYLIYHYRDNPIQAKLAVMKQSLSCKKQG